MSNLPSNTSKEMWVTLMNTVGNLFEGSLKRKTEYIYLYQCHAAKGHKTA